MNVHTIMNSPVTRIQVFAVWALCAIMLLGALGLVALNKIERQQVPIVGGHGIETSWPSVLGDNRLWSLSQGGADYRPWLEEHIAAVKMAEELMPIREKK